MLGKLCVCGHEMKPQGKQTLEMNGSSLGSNLWTDHVEVDMYICSWCGRMAFFEPEDVREKRFRDACDYDNLFFFSCGKQELYRLLPCLIRPGKQPLHPLLWEHLR